MSISFSVDYFLYNPKNSDSLLLFNFMKEFFITNLLKETARLDWVLLIFANFNHLTWDFHPVIFDSTASRTFLEDLYPLNYSFFQRHQYYLSDIPFENWYPFHFCPQNFYSICIYYDGKPTFATFIHETIWTPHLLATPMH